MNFDIRDLLATNAERDSLYGFLVQRLPKKGVSTERKGGSNGSGTAETIDSKACRKLFHYPGSTPRQSRGVVFVLHNKRCWVFYTKAYQVKHEVTCYPYAVPVMAGQLELTPEVIAEGPPKLFDVLRVCVESKILVAAVVGALNTRIAIGSWKSFMPPKYHRKIDYHRGRLIVSEAVKVQSATNRKIAEQHDPTDRTSIMLHHASTPKWSVVSSALDVHEDNTREHPEHPEYAAFFEPKLLFPVPNRSSGTGENGNMPALGRGGGGFGVFMFACKYLV